MSRKKEAAPPGSSRGAAKEIAEVKRPEFTLEPAGWKARPEPEIDGYFTYVESDGPPDRRRRSKWSQVGRRLWALWIEVRR